MNKNRIILILILLIALTGCAPLNFYSKLDPFIASGDYTSADAIVDKEKKQYAGAHELLYYFDKGSLLQMLGDYKGSTKALGQAEEAIDELYTKSAVKEVSSFLSNDMNLPYEGEDFEQVMVNIMKALNFMYAGDYDGARVEARKVNNRLNLLTDRYEGKNKYKDDAFARYLSAVSYESEGSLDDAYIDYKKSYRAYLGYGGLFSTEVPRQLKQDLLRVSQALNRSEDFNEYKEAFPDTQFKTQGEFNSLGDVMLVIYDGMAPYKVSYYITTPVHNSKTGHTTAVRVAFPKFVPRPQRVDYASAFVSGADYSSSVYEDINTMAVANLQEKNIFISVKAIARATTKYLAGQALSDGGKNKWLDLAASIYSAASEQADTRSWRTLPGRFHMIRLQLTPGKHEIKVKLNMTDGTVMEKTISVKIKAKQKKAFPVYAF